MAIESSLSGLGLSGPKANTIVAQALPTYRSDGGAMPRPMATDREACSGRPLEQLQSDLRVRPETSGRIAEFSEHEAD